MGISHVPGKTVNRIVLVCPHQGSRLFQGIDLVFQCTGYRRQVHIAVTKECIDTVLSPWDDPLTQDEIDALVAAGYKPVTEPEYVSQCGGVAGEDANGNPVTVDGMGCYGDCCELAEHIGVLMWVAGPWPHADKPETSADVPAGAWRPVTLPDPNGDGVTKLNELECLQVEIDELPYCNGIWVHVSLHLQQLHDDDWGDYFPDNSKWEWWPTNALQNDGVTWDIGFELLYE